MLTGPQNTIGSPDPSLKGLLQRLADAASFSICVDRDIKALTTELFGPIGLDKVPACNESNPPKIPLLDELHDRITVIEHRLRSIDESVQRLTRASQ